MGYDQHQHSSSSGAMVGIVVSVLLIAVLGIVAVAGAWLFLVRTTVVQSQAMAIEDRLVTEVQVTKSAAQQAVTQQTVAHVRIADGVVQIQQSGVVATPDPRLNIEVKLDREGIASIDGEMIGLDELGAQLAKLKDETSNAFSVQINADSECLVKHIIPVMDVCDEIGDIDFHVVSPEFSDSSDDAGSAEN